MNENQMKGLKSKTKDKHNNYLLCSPLINMEVPE